MHRIGRVHLGYLKHEKFILSQMLGKRFKPSERFFRIRMEKLKILEGLLIIDPLYPLTADQCVRYPLLFRLFFPNRFLNDRLS